MNDFLTRVAQRAVGLAPAIRPVVAARYAPTRLLVPETSEGVEAEPASSTKATDLSMESGSNTLPPSVMNPHRQTSADLTREKPLSPDDKFLPEQSTPIPSIAPDEKGRQTPAAFDDTAKPAVFESPTDSSESGESFAVDIRAQTDEPTLVVMTNDRDGGDSHAAGTNQKAASDNAPYSRETLRTTYPTEQNVAVNPNGSFMPESEPDTLGARETTRRVSDGGQPLRESVPASTRLLRPSTDERPDANSPVIRVTIGRIEVRAVTPPPARVESPAPPVPKLSLDEFLRQNDGRRR